MILPTFFVIGASKAGTTSLHHYLDAHPEIAMTDPKEPHLIIGPGWRDRLHGYALLFPWEAPVRGEVSPGYSTHPTNPDAAEHIAELVPDARLIYLVRDPVERTIAHYAQAFTVGREERPLEEAVRPEDPANYYVAASRYATQAEVYLQKFDQERLLIVDQADLRENRPAVLRRVFTHVGADPGYWDDEYAIEYGVRGVDNVRLGELGKRLRDSSLHRRARRLLPRGARRRIVSVARRGLGRGSVYPAVSREFRAQLAEALAPEAERLRQLTGQRFAGWSV